MLAFLLDCKMTTKFYNDLLKGGPTDREKKKKDWENIRKEGKHTDQIDTSKTKYNIISNRTSEGATNRP